ncbi:hypothetical protein L0152_32395 [bacterium]|nr:hypothetical protein [bacterium]
MAEEVVVKESLSEEMIEAGAQLITALDEYMKVTGALWLYLPELNTWRLLIISPDVRIRGPRYAYEKIQKVISHLPPNSKIVSLSNIQVVDSNEPFVVILKTAIRTTDGISRIRFAKNVVNGVLVHDALIYRLT